MSIDLCLLYYCMSHFTYWIILVKSGEDIDISDVAWPLSSICIDYAAHCRGLQSAAGSSMFARSLTIPGAHGAWSSGCAPRSEELHHSAVWQQWKWNFVVFCITSTTWWNPASDFLSPQSLSFSVSSHLLLFFMDITKQITSKLTTNGSPLVSKTTENQIKLGMSNWVTLHQYRSFFR